eukprot:GFKZ01005960.1.p1 GENE.GFKZ01005960.1~~GFKZ01005960.1.p1  ORF type:complete len:569 (+),score=97.36 GFKZ01005960.1:83-1708(+)
MASSSGAFKSREAWKAAKELEEARKAGTAPPAVDDDGKIINPHIPEYISRAPWYLSQERPSLKHQKNQNEKKRKFDSLGKWLPRGQTTGPAATKFRKGACENCGAITHTAKNCLERPRRRGAKLTGRNIRPDEVVGTVHLDFQGKRDRWNGYDESVEYDRVHHHYSKLDAERKRLKAERLDSELRTGKRRARPSGSDTDDSDDDDSQDGAADGTVVQQTDHGSKMSARNLRIREDTAKYLRNLDPNSAYYDPKSRAMRADPNPHVKPEDKDYAGDNFVRYTGDVRQLAQMELHAMAATELGRNLPHLQAEPSRAEALFKEFESKKKDMEERQRADIVKKYGGQEHSVRPDGIFGVKQTESFVEYSRDGRALRRAKEAIPVSKYPEDVYDKDHTAVWGSFFKDGEWGYACCHQTVRNCMCTGETGKRAAIETEKEMKQRIEAAVAKRDPKPLTEQWEQAEREREENAPPPEEAAEVEKRKVKEIEKEIRRQEEEEKRMVAADGDRRYSSWKEGGDGKMSETVMEAYRIRKQMAEDPMANYPG